MKQFPNASVYANDPEQKSVAPLSSAPLVLVVDDSATNRIVVERQMIKLGCAVLSASDGAGALAVIEKGGVNLVLLDCQMPDMSGYDVAKSIREKIPKTASSESAYLPIVAISGDSDAQHMQRCFDSGMDAVLVKPLPLPALRHLLAFWCGREHVAAPVAGKGLLLDLQSLYQSTSREDFDALYRCVQQAEFFMIAKLVHRMKGAALTIGAKAVVESLERMEAIVARTSCGHPVAMTPVVATAELTALLELLRKQLPLT